MNPDQNTSLPTQKSFSISSALRALAQGITGPDGSVTMTKEQVNKLVKEGKVSVQPDGTYRLNVTAPSLSSTTQAALPDSFRILQSDRLDPANRTQTLERPSTIQTTKAATLQTINAEPAPPSIASDQANPYLESASGARIRNALMTAYALQAEVANLMRHEQAEFNKAIWESALSQARGIRLTTQGKTLGLLASATAATATATGLIAQGTFTMMNKMRAVDMKNEAERIRAKMNTSSEEKTSRKQQSETSSPTLARTERRKASKKTGGKGQLEIELQRQESQRLDISLERDVTSSPAQRARGGSTSEESVRVKRSSGPNLAALERAQALEREAARLEMGIEGMKAVSGVQQNLAAAVRDGTKIIGTKQEEAGRIVELYSQTLQRVLEQGSQQAQAQTKEADEHAKQLLQIVSSKAKAQTSMGQTLWKI
ncbi:hypothetical protein [Candidatus Similichlamydia laticola]|uniref:Uncharacterized protein n=1 Tax=Candidatus Similichlamydia laticola TaxID=2170265 RepID=A0A369KLB5_9BACT|nr:hypothetical protein [Candidatus Similichlamydia laticola]RDB31806.1 hypothetical protein HAT2_00085 [Candidatus Similichlamydia laticola]